MITCSIKQERPVQGRQPLRVIMRCADDSDVSPTVKQLNTTASLLAIKTSISASVIRAYFASGLGIDTPSGGLLDVAANRFSVFVKQTLTKEFEIEANWDSSVLPHFEAQLFGARTRPHLIRPNRAGGLFWTGIRGGHPVALVRHPGSAIPAHDFIRLDRQVERDIQALVDEPKEEAKRVVRVADSIAFDIQSTKSFRRLTLHGIRRILRRNGLSEGAARAIAQEFLRFKSRTTVSVTEVTLLILRLV